jgi:2-dehydro-3-deoxyphosphogluconate aldolase/(4S)-4-hydroxy-2-oxoglutarate aldolase
MSEKILERLEAAPVVPLIQADEAGVAVKVAQALVEGGLTVVEVVLRTDSALHCLQAIANDVPGVIAGAGTVLDGAQARAAADAGARFLVSPGLHDSVVAAASEHGLPLYPGVATATEAQRAWNMGLRLLKFFPAAQAGGIPMVRALSSVFRELKFMPTGGVSAANLADYLALPQVFACGGSWLTPADAVARGDFRAITKLAREAVAIARSTKR